MKNGVGGFDSLFKLALKGRLIALKLLFLRLLYFAVLMLFALRSHTLRLMTSFGFLRMLLLICQFNLFGPR